MPVDTSSYPTQSQQPNVLNTLGAAAQIQNVMNQNKLFQQQYNTNLALSNIYKEAINPDGTLDQSKLTGLLQRDPNATYGLPQAYQNSQEAQVRGLNINQQQLQLARQNMETLQSYITPLLGMENPTSSDIYAAAAKAISVGHVNPNTIAGVLAGLPKGPGGQVDESQIKPWLQQQNLQLMDANSKLQALSPPPTLVSNGQTITPMRLPAVGAPSVAGPSIQTQLPPTAQVFDPASNQMRYVGPGGGGQPGTGGGSAPWQGGSAKAGSPLGTAPPLGAASAADVTAQGAAHSGLALNSAAEQVPQQKAILGNLEGALDRFTSGPGADWKKVAQAFVNQNTQALFGKSLFDPKKIASQEEFNKQATMLAQNQFQQLGGTGTNMQLGSSMETSPNAALSKMGNKAIIALLKGNADAIAAKRQAWQQWLGAGNGPQSYNEFSTAFNKDWDPRAFQLQYLDPKEAQTMLSGMNANEKKDFNRVMNIGVKNGWVQLPQWLQGNGR